MKSTNTELVILCSCSINQCCMARASLFLDLCPLLGLPSSPLPLQLLVAKI